MRRVPRHRFVPAADADRAYDDCALPTSEGQTISQPIIVARMTELLAVRPGDKVLEVGTGSGYQTAILAVLGAQIVTIERHAGLSDSARTALGDLGLVDRVTFAVADGSMGWLPGAPYHGILAAAAAPRIPPAFLDQAADRCRIVLPIGDRREQRLMVYQRESADDEWRVTPDLACRFVPLVGEGGWNAP